MINTAILFLLIGHGVLMSSLAEILGSGEEDAVSCVDEGKVTKLAHLGWPYSIDCEGITVKFRRRNYTLYKKSRKDTAECILRHANGSIFWNLTSTPGSFYLSSAEYPTFDIHNTSDLRFQMELKIPSADFCSKLDVQVHVGRASENLTCENLHKKVKVMYKEVDKGKPYKMTCNVGYSEEPKLFLQDEEDVNYEWWHNCSKVLPGNTFRQKDGSLTVSGSDFSNGGIYTCAVSHEGQIRFLARHQLCIKYPNTGTNALKCPELVEAKEGEDLNVTCNIDLGLGHFPFLLLDMTWYKMANGTKDQICRALPYNGLTNSSYSKDIQCLNSERRVAGKCFQYLPPVEERLPDKHSFEFSLFVRGLKASDEGEYLLIFASFSNEGKKAKIFVSINQDNELTSNASTVAIVVSVLLILIILAFLCIWRKMDLLWFFKKRFGAYDNDDKTYVAYLVYHFSTETMDERSQNLMENLIGSLQDFMDSIGARTFDDYRDGNDLQMQIENIARRQKDCHRIIIILNKEYVTDHWNLHKAYMALRNMIEEGIRVIFVALPGVEESYNELPDEPKTALKHAMKMNTTIKWSGKLPLSGSFRRHLEYALPKLQKNKPRIEPNSPERIMMQTVV